MRLPGGVNQSLCTQVRVYPEVIVAWAEHHARLGQVLEDLQDLARLSIMQLFTLPAPPAAYCGLPALGCEMCSWGTTGAVELFGGETCQGPEAWLAGPDK